MTLVQVSCSTRKNQDEIVYIYAIVLNFIILPCTLLLDSARRSVYIYIYIYIYIYLYIYIYIYIYGFNCPVIHRVKYLKCTSILVIFVIISPPWPTALILLSSRRRGPQL